MKLQKIVEHLQKLHPKEIDLSLDRTRNLLEKLGSLTEYKNLTILDCFTYGKGTGSEVFSNCCEIQQQQASYPQRTLALSDRICIESH